ncbi:UxaA family hydrolase [Glacieibacterium frigidum]|uniref:Altronate dehydratase n=1 Tax=Glacieibacterium frigidum TaxID=2593303 RepID=A0A552U7M4_9SPHN|nr:altronate dehydratase family protein [Glacieibacterium frigidum]TRW14216.1 altronate dehydratase [Glacieibacterium frigidum]
MSAVAALRLHPHDDVAVAVVALAPGAALPGGGHAAEAIPAGHKVALHPLAAGSVVRKYGQAIGATTQAVAAGAWVHVHNLGLGDAAPRLPGGGTATAPVPVTPRTFEGYLRADGRGATRNYLAVVTSVNCSAHVARAVARRAEDRLHEFPGIDGVVPITHASGCALDGRGAAIDVLRRTLAGYARHANFAGVLMLGLGCETNQLPDLLAAEGLRESDTLGATTIQGEGGTAATIAAGLERILAMAAAATGVKRVPMPLSHLTLGLQCGGSDGYSGITANPALGAAVDRLVAHGGAAILSETPEIYGAEHLLTCRATPVVADALMARIAWWEAHVAATGGSMDNNPSAGNKAGGLTTILEKSLGAVAKAGSTPLNAVYGYAEPVTARGLSFMDTPGYDPVAATGQVAGGANLIAFTTGRGSVFGCRPAPSLKLATNSDLFRRMAGDMDIDCGRILGGMSIDAMGEEIFEALVATASGRLTKSEELGIGDDEIQPWRLGATM